MKLYKLTNAEFRTRNRMQWGENVTNTADESIPAILCSSGVLHAYPSPLLAAFMAPVHVDADMRTLWEAEGEVVVSDGTKVGCRQLTTLRQIALPEVTTEQRIKFAILCVLQVYVDAKFTEWANNWLSGKVRSVNAANAAANAAASAARWAAARAAAASAANAAASAANAAASAANAAARWAAARAAAASAASAAEWAARWTAARAAAASAAASAARWAAEWAAEAAEWAAEAAASAAANAANAGSKPTGIDFDAIAKQAMS